MTNFTNETDRLNTSQRFEPISGSEAIFIWIVSVIEVPVVSLTLFALCSLVKSHRASSVYVIHLILSDLLQMLIILVQTTSLGIDALWSAYKYCMMVGLYFMASIAIERYLLVGCPHWYRSHHSVKLSCFISLIVWLVPLCFLQVDHLGIFSELSQSLAFFIPYPVILLCFVGTWKVLAHTRSLTSHKRKTVLYSLSLVLFNYSFLILPISITSFSLMFMADASKDQTAMAIYVFCHCLLYLNPLADCLLYLFLRSDVDSIMTSLCCGRISSESGTFSTTSHLNTMQ